MSVIGLCVYIQPIQLTINQINKNMIVCFPAFEDKIFSL